MHKHCSTQTSLLDKITCMKKVYHTINMYITVTAFNIFMHCTYIPRTVHQSAPFAKSHWFTHMQNVSHGNETAPFAKKASELHWMHSCKNTHKHAQCIAKISVTESYFNASKFLLTNMNCIWMHKCKNNHKHAQSSTIWQKATLFHVNSD